MTMWSKHLAVGCAEVSTGGIVHDIELICNDMTEKPEDTWLHNASHLDDVMLLV